MNAGIILLVDDEEQLRKLVSRIISLDRLQIERVTYHIDRTINLQLLEVSGILSDQIVV